MSAARIDHVAAAKQSVKAIAKTLWQVVPMSRGGLTNDERVRIAAVHAAEAQAEATLALVEQQRIANLIALATGVDVISGHGIARMASNEAHRHLVSDPNGEFLPEIREALGMS